MHSISTHKYPFSSTQHKTHNTSVLSQLILAITLQPLFIFKQTTMEHYSTTQYHLMWMKSKFPSSFNISPATFQEPQGGFPWPPRSYTCTFCRREFRSAQALGGHMNVHRRDRARLKQSSPPQKAESEFLRRQKQPSDSYHEPVALENSLDRRNLQVPPSIFTPIMNSEEVSADLNRRRSGKPGFRVDDNDEDFIETKLSMGLDLVDHEINVVCKRHKTCNGVSPLPFLHMKLCSSERCSTSSSMEDIDLELRLGDPPAVK